MPTTSRHAHDLLGASDVVDLHVDTFIWHRLFRWLGVPYPMNRSHRPGPIGGWFWGHADFPRARDTLTGAAWIITTQPFRPGPGRASAFRDNLRRLLDQIAAAEGVAFAGTAADYDRCRGRGEHAAFIGVQGGNAFGNHPRDVIDSVDPRLVLVTLMHLTPSAIGASTARLGPPSCSIGLPDRGLTTFGRHVVDVLEERGVLVDLAHASPKTFDDTVRHHRRDAPLLVSHTGVDGATRHWRNLNDRQLRAIAESGGCVGIMFHAEFIGSSPLGSGVREVARHFAHAVRTIGADHVCLGSDWDGAIMPPRGLQSPACLGPLVQALLDEGLSDDDVVAVLGRSFVRLLRRHRPGTPAVLEDAPPGVDGTR